MRGREGERGSNGMKEWGINSKVKEGGKGDREGRERGRGETHTCWQ